MKPYFTPNMVLRNRTAHIIILLCFAVGSLCGPRQLCAAEQESGEDLLDISLEDLMDVEVVVVSASRQAQKIGDLSVPVSVMTSADIHYSGLTNVPEVLQFAPGLDVIRLDRNRYAVGVRGLHDFTSDRTLTLINGRRAESPLFGGSEFFRYPLLMEDIDRIEIVRGPGGAAWGANAFTGVINVITKKPGDVLGHFGSTTINEYGDSYTHLRTAQKSGKLAWRFSVGYEDKETSDDAGAGKYESTGSPVINGIIGFDSFEASDKSRDWRFDTEADYSYSDQTTISLGAGYAHDTMGNFEFGGYYPPGDAEFETLRSFVKVYQDLGGGTSRYLQWSGNFAYSEIPSLTEWDTYENDIEGQLNLSPVEAHQVSIGGNIRVSRISATTHSPQDLILNGEPFDEQSVGAFLIDRWILSDQLTLEGQIRGDWYSETQTDWSSRLSALYSLDQKRDSIVRLSVAKAFRAPLASLRRTSMTRIPLGGPLYGFNVVEPISDLDNEESWALEAGYTAKIDGGWQLRADTYYQRFEDMIGYESLPDPLGLGRLIFQADNIDGADSYGAEIELTKSFEKTELSFWYAYNGFDTDISDQSLRAYAPSKHKVGLSGRLFLANNLTINANYRFTDTTVPFATTLDSIGVSHRLDLTFAKRFNQGNGEVMVGVTDLLNQTDGPNFGLGQITAHETPGRTFFVRLQTKF